MEISKKAFRPIPALVPPPNIWKVFTSMALALLVENKMQAKTLVPLRDTLFPHPIFGQLQFPEAHALIETAAV